MLAFGIWELGIGLVWLVDWLALMVDCIERKERTEESEREMKVSLQ